MKLKNSLNALILIAVFTASGLYAGSTGKISGIIHDQESGEVLIGANIMIEGTSLGAASDMDGVYYIINVPPGQYTMIARMIGYKDVRVEDVHVSVDLTTEINLTMISTVVETGESVTVTAERPMVIKDLTATTAVMDADEISALPVSEITEAVELQAGLVKDAGGGLHVRGGRQGEISYWIDGIPVTDVYDGGSVVEVNKDMVQELQVVSGAFNAEYGQAMSGIVNITTKEGSNKFGGSFTTYFGDHVSGSFYDAESGKFKLTDNKDIFYGIDDVSPAAIRNFEGSLFGPIVKDKVFFYVNARQIYFDGWLNGRRRYNPWAVTGNVVLPDEVIQEIAPEYWPYRKDYGNGVSGFNYVIGTNAVLDSAVVYDNLTDPLSADPDSFAVYYNRLRENHKDGLGDDKRVPMNWNKKTYLQGKMIYKITPSFKLSYNYILDDVDYTEWSGFDHERDYQLNPDGAPKKFRTGNTHIFQATHALNVKTYYQLGFSYFKKKYEKYLYEKTNNALYVHPDISLQDSYSFKTGGTAGTALDNPQFQRETKTMLVKMDLTSQITSKQQIKAGVEYRYHDVFREDFTLRPVETQTNIDLVFDSPFIQTRILDDSTIYHSQYRHHPVEFSAYLQDKMEFKDFIVNVGVRFDYFEPDGVYLNDESDPMIYNPIRPENRYKDWGSDGIPNTYDADGTENNGIRDTGEPAVTLEERKTYWYKNATPKYQISPRLGFSFPITERGIIHFSYGHFFQVPRFERLYQNPDFELTLGTGNLGVIGNTDLKPENTVSGEIGLQQQLSSNLAMSLTGYFRDIRDLAGTRSDEIVMFGGSARYNKIVNSDFGFIRGLIIALNKRFSDNWAASADYTMQIAKGSNSDPEAARNARAGGADPEVQLNPLDWDQRHTVNVSFTYGAADWGVSTIAQWGSGLPYTPSISEDISTLLTNTQTKPATFNVDVRAYKDFNIGFATMTVFLRIFNLFDTLNEVNVYNDTGRAGFTLEERRALTNNPPEIINTIEDWYTNPTHYSEPRRIEAGITVGF